MGLFSMVFVGGRGVIIFVYSNIGTLGNCAIAQGVYMVFDVLLRATGGVLFATGRPGFAIGTGGSATFTRGCAFEIAIDVFMRANGVFRFPTVRLLWNEIFFVFVFFEGPGRLVGSFVRLGHAGVVVQQRFGQCGLAFQDKGVFTSVVPPCQWFAITTIGGRYGLG